MVFLSDLDNTLIYSCRKIYSNKNFVVEYLNDKPQSYMTEKTFEYLKNNTQILLVPITTRTVEQYNRIFVFNEGGDIPCHYALTCNGGELLKDGKKSTSWHRETIEISRSELPWVYETADLLKSLTVEGKVHCVSDYMYYGVCKEPKLIENKLKMKADLNKVFIGSDNRKVYVLANSVNKGQALKRFKRELGIAGIFAAGDSIFDISMLEQADAAIGPREIIKELKNPNSICIMSDILSDGICDILNNLEERSSFW